MIYIAEKYTRYIYNYTRLYMTAINMYTHNAVSLFSFFFNVFVQQNLVVLLVLQLS